MGRAADVTSATMPGNDSRDASTTNFPFTATSSSVGWSLSGQKGQSS